MKNGKILILGASLIVGALASGCGNSGKVRVGILQYAEFSALDSAREGFKNALAKNGYDESKVEFIYSNAAEKDADNIAFAKDLVGRCDLTLGIATPSAKALKSAAIDKGITNPVLFTAVTDPVDAGLVESLSNGKGFVTGTSDLNPIANQIALIKECNPSVDKVGILYTEGETNSVVQANTAKSLLEADGISVVIKTATNASDVSSTTAALVAESGIDAIYIPTDNIIAKNAGAVKSAVQGSHVLVVAGEEGMLKDCGSITLSIDYLKLGEMTGEMAASILKGEKKAADIAVPTISVNDCEYVMSSANAAAAGVTIPDTVKAKCRDVSLA